MCYIINKAALTGQVFVPALLAEVVEFVVIGVARTLVAVVPLDLLVAHERLAALSRDLDEARVGAGCRGQGQLAGAQRHAAHRPVDAGALVLAVGLEVLPVLEDPAVVLAGAALQLGCR